MSIRYKIAKFAVKVGKKALKNNKKFRSTLRKVTGGAIGRKAMSSAQRAALKKAVRASALARRKAVKVAAGKIVRKGITKRTGFIARRRFPTKFIKAKLVSQTTKRIKIDRSKIAKFNAVVGTGPKAKAYSQTRKSLLKLDKLMAKELLSRSKDSAKTAAALSKIDFKRVGVKASGGTRIDWGSSLLWSAGLTAAVNPSYTAEKLREAKDAVKRKLS